jgi:protein-tyrosine phosphatase
MPIRIGRRTFLAAGGATAAAAVLTPAFAGTALADPDVQPRVVTIDGSLNTRDVGGYRTDRGATVRYGRMFRSGTLSSVTDAGLAQLAALKLHTVIDYRTDAEITQSGPDRVPAGVRVVNLPVGAAAAPQERVQDVGENQLAPAAPAPTEPDPVFIATYRSYTSNPESRKQYAASFRLLANPGALPLLGNDSAGGGRVGWTTALLLTLLGVPREVVYAEYLYSNVQLGGTYVFKEYLDAAFDQATTQYGSLDAFFARGLGITPVTRALLCLNFLDGHGH